MAGDASCIGLSVGGAEAWRDLTARASVKAREVPSKRGHYLVWECPEGPQIWFHGERRRDGSRNITGFNFHFTGPSRVPTNVTHLIDAPKAGPWSLERPYEGKLRGWAAPVPGAGPEAEGEVSYLCDLPDYDVPRGWKPPRACEVQVAAFARELTIFPDADAFDAAQAGANPPALSRALVSAGAVLGEAAWGETEAAAQMTGIVMDFEERSNPLTDQAFLWMSVYTLGGTVDVIADPAAAAGVPERGAVVHGSFRLSGKTL